MHLKRMHQVQGAVNEKFGQGHHQNTEKKQGKLSRLFLHVGGTVGINRTHIT
jgi:hypothetical protein